MKTTTIWRWPKYEDDLKLKKKLIEKTVPGLSLHNLSCACFLPTLYKQPHKWKEPLQKAQVKKGDKKKDGNNTEDNLKKEGSIKLKMTLKRQPEN